MTGPEHYRAAEALLSDLTQRRDAANRQHSDSHLGEAQVHATLALAASLGLSANLPRFDQEAWQLVAGSGR
jgi:hypothetical protein